MPKPRRPENKGLPKRWKFAHGAYYYNVPPGLEAMWEGKKLFRLGKTLPEAAKEWAKRIEPSGDANTIGQLLDRYALEVVPTKAPRTQLGNTRHIERLRRVFGEMKLTSIEPQDIYKYYDKRTAKTDARQEIAVLSHAYTKAVEWGYINRHPFMGQKRLKGQKSRQRYVQDWEIEECMSLDSRHERGSIPMIQAYIELKLLLGLRQSDMLRLSESDILEDGIHVTPHKTRKSSGRAVIYEWTDDLRAAVANARKMRPVDISKWLFCTRRGECYIDEETGKAEGFSSMWQRFMARLLKETKVTERFTENDLRAKVASDADSDERAREILTHSSVSITRRVYRRKPAIVRPAK